MSTLKQTIKAIGRRFDAFCERSGGITLRMYQLKAATAILKSIRNKQGLTIVVIFPRQSGKDELITNLLTYLAMLYAHREAGIVVVNPTYKPQTINAILRFERRLSSNLITRMFWKKRSDFMRMIGTCIVSFLSGDASANVVGATASLLLVLNEAQDIEHAIYDKRFVPMTASTNATKVVLGTVWTSDTVLAREERAAREAEKLDGIRRVFRYTADDVRRVVPAYGAFVDGQVQKLGRQHPLVKTQYFCEEIDAIAAMFNAGRRALMQGDQPAQTAPEPGHIYALIIDVGGQDEALLNLDGMGNPGRDYVTVDVVDVDLSSLPLLQSPIYRVVKRLEWHGVNHVDIFGALCALVDVWGVLYIVIDATGVGEGLWGMFAKKYPTKTIPVKFTQQSKSEIGYGYLGIVDTGRFRDCDTNPTVDEQYFYCKSEVLIGPLKTMRWGVKDGTRNTSGELVHDDWVTCDALTAELDKLEWFIPSETSIIEPEEDLLESMGRNY